VQGTKANPKDSDSFCGHFGYGYLLIDAFSVLGEPAGYDVCPFIVPKVLETTCRVKLMQLKIFHTTVATARSSCQWIPRIFLPTMPR